MQQNNTVWEREHLQNNILRLEEYYTGETGICIVNRGLVDIGVFWPWKAPEHNSKYFRKKCQFYNTEAALTGLIVILFSSERLLQTMSSVIPSPTPPGKKSTCVQTLLYISLNTVICLTRPVTAAMTLSLCWSCSAVWLCLAAQRHCRV